MLNHFPTTDIDYPHRNRDYFIAGFTFFCVAVSLVIDGSASLETQKQLGVIAWIFLTGLLVGENREVRMQVVVAVAFAQFIWKDTPIDLEMCLLMSRLVMEWYI